MTALTRRRDPDTPQETWLIYYGDVQVGVIAERVGNPTSTARWQWSCGFYPGSHPSEQARGTAGTFDQARGAFELAWRFFWAKHGGADFEEYRRDRAFHAWKQAMSDAVPETADAGCRRPRRLLLRRDDRYR
jgi:hypothetical protein